MNTSNSEYDLTSRQLKWAEWWLVNKGRLKKILIIFLIILNVGIYSLAVYNLIIFLVYSKEYHKMIQEMTSPSDDYSLLRAIRQPQPLGIVSTHLLYAGKDAQGFSKYDIGAIVKNDNKQWMVLSLEYNFLLSNGLSAATQKTSFLPNQEKYLFSLGQKISDQAEIRNAEFNIVNIQWRRIKEPQKKLLDILPQLIIKDQKINYLIGSDGIETPRLEFTIINQSIFNFWQLDYMVAFYKGREIVAVYPINIKNLMSEEKRSVKIFLDPSLPQTTEIVFSLNTNILDPDIIIYFKK
ncbi:MAG: hypothetical protein AAB465_00390 [Patescibacteria group bacterium]